MQQHVTARSISTWSENFPSFEVEYTLQNAKCVLINSPLQPGLGNSFKMVEGGNL